MSHKIRSIIYLVLILGLPACQPQTEEGIGLSYKVPVEYYKLDNGLKVILSEDHTSPIVTTAVYYNIGFRIEPQGRTGFAHLFEHMMFQGSKNLGKMEFVNLVQENGVVLNGSTRYDYTNYFEILPAHKLETALWAEADRMKGLAITQENLINQQGVVSNEVKVNVLNQPYGGFPWLWMPQVANQNWYNAHNFYGDLEDLEAATLEDVQAFFDLYYSPNNAALAVVGDFNPEEAKLFIEKHFGSIPSVELPELPDISEPRQTEAKREIKEFPKANRPAFSFAYHMPPRNSPEYYAMGLIDQMLLQGDDALLHQALVQGAGLTGSVNGGINFQLGNMYNYNGPMLWMGFLYYDNNIEADSIIQVIDETLEKFINQGITQEAVDRALVKIRSDFYSQVSATYGFGRADFLASFALFDDNPYRINDIEEEFKNVTPAVIKGTVTEYLRSSNRTILIAEPGAVENPLP